LAGNDVLTAVNEPIVEPPHAVRSVQIDVVGRDEPVKLHEPIIAISQ
jgi:hypothetical protein